METDLVVEGLKFMILGMGTVFLFLGMLIAVMHLMSKFISSYLPQQASSSALVLHQERKKKEKVVAAIVAAIIAEKKAKNKGL